MLLLSLPYALKLRMPNSRGAAGIRLLRPAHLREPCSTPTISETWTSDSPCRDGRPSPLWAGFKETHRRLFWNVLFS